MGSRIIKLVIAAVPHQQLQAGQITIVDSNLNPTLLGPDKDEMVLRFDTTRSANGIKWTTESLPMFGFAGARNLVSVGSPEYMGFIGGYNAAVGTEAMQEFYFPYKCELRKFRGYVGTNAASGNSTMNVRKNGASGGVTLTWPGLTTGLQSDLSGVVQYSAGDRGCLLITANGIGSLRFDSFSCEVIAVD